MFKRFDLTLSHSQISLRYKVVIVF